MTSQSPRIYLYKITFEEVPYYYYGVKKEDYYNQEYWGTPITHKWCWELYTPKKQILQFFDFTDEGWIEAQEIEKRLIRPFYNTDKWCLNENCGGKISLKVCKETGRKNYENKVGIFSFTKEELSENGKIGGKRGFETMYNNQIGIFSPSFDEKRSELGKKLVKYLRENKAGIYGLSFEELSEAGKVGYVNGLGKLSTEEKSENGRKGGKVSGKKHKKNKTGCLSLTPEERLKVVEKTNSQRWICTETGFITTSGPLTRYQKARGIDTSKRKRIA
jgi:general stress protein YciG